MKQDAEKQFLETVRQQLDRHAGALDDVSAARLEASRRRALEQQGRSRRGWLPVTGLATAAAAVLAVVVWYQVPFEGAALPGEWDLLATSEELELIDELDFYAWLEETQSSS